MDEVTGVQGRALARLDELHEQTIQNGTTFQDLPPPALSLCVS
jgi:hypothetical protein